MTVGRTQRSVRKTRGERRTPREERTCLETRRSSLLLITIAAKFRTEIWTKGITGGFSGDPQELDSLDIQGFNLCDGTAIQRFTADQ
jgi:hypothetical protein